MRSLALVLVLVLVLAGCSAKPSSETVAFCERGVAHIFALTLVGPPGSEPQGDEARVIEIVKGLALSRCKSEGLSRAQLDCILAAHHPSWSDQLRACTAFAARPPTWITTMPTRDERRAFEGLPPIPDGPRETKRTYRQLLAFPDATCGLTEAGAIECWGEPRLVAFPRGTFVQIAATRDVACGRDVAGAVQCAGTETATIDHVPGEALTDFAIGEVGGCGVRASDQRLVCWSFYANSALTPPDGSFVSVTVGDSGACARGVDGDVRCFGDRPPPPPPAGAIAYSEDQGSCTITADHRLTCVGTDRDGTDSVGHVRHGGDLAGPRLRDAREWRRYRVLGRERGRRVQRPAVNGASGRADSSRP